MKIEKQKRYSAAERKILLETYKASGLKKREWCQENTLGLSTLQRWLQQENKQTQAQPVQSWLPVKQVVTAQLDSLDIHIGKCKIAVDMKTDKQLLATVIGVLVEVC